MGGHQTCGPWSAGWCSAHREPPGAGKRLWAGCRVPREATTSEVSGLRGQGARPALPRASALAGAGGDAVPCSVREALDPRAGREAAGSHGVGSWHRGAFRGQRAAWGLGTRGGGSTVRVRSAVSLRAGRQLVGPGARKPRGLGWVCPRVSGPREDRAPALALQRHPLLPLPLLPPPLGGRFPTEVGRAE